MKTIREKLIFLGEALKCDYMTEVNIFSFGNFSFFA